MIKKKIIGIIIFILIISPLTISEKTESEKYINSKKISNFLNSIEQDDIYVDIIESEIYSKFKDLVGNESTIQVCGPSYINSSGKGLHVGRTLRFVIIEIPIRINDLIFDAFTFPRVMMVFWLMFCLYNNENASTTIYPLKKGEGLKIDENNSINISGKHMILCGVFIFRHPKAFRKKIITPLLSLLTGIPKDNITFPIVNISGKNFLEFKFPFWVLNTIQNSIMPLKLKIPLYGFFINLTFKGYTPFVLWVNKTKI